jgi:hypothetical protein
MQNNTRLLKVITIIAMVIFSASLAFAEQVINFKDGTVIKGEIQNETLTVQTSFGKLTPGVDKIIFISEGNVELRDGSKIMGNLVIDAEGLVVKTKYGTWTLHFKAEDLQMITFSR